MSALTFKLTGKTRKGKNRVHELGERWRLTNMLMSVQFSSKAGPWLMLEPIDVTDPVRLQKASRWVHRNDDEDFTVEEIAAE